MDFLETASWKVVREGRKSTKQCWKVTFQCRKSTKQCRKVVREGRKVSILPLYNSTIH